MRVTVFGANGIIGRAIVAEALERGHEVVAAVRSPEKLELDHPRLEVRRARIDDEAEVAAAVAGTDAVVSSVGGLGHDDPRIVIRSAPALFGGLRTAGVRRLLVVGTAGTLITPSGRQRRHEPGFPEVLRDESGAQAELLELLGQQDVSSLEWTYFSPPALIEPGQRTGVYELGLDHLPFDADGNSWISNEDYAVATLDELEEPRHVGRRFTATSSR